MFFKKHTPKFCFAFAIATIIASTLSYHANVRFVDTAYLMESMLYAKTMSTSTCEKAYVVKEKKEICKLLDGDDWQAFKEFKAYKQIYKDINKEYDPTDAWATINPSRVADIIAARSRFNSSINGTPLNVKKVTGERIGHIDATRHITAADNNKKTLVEALNNNHYIDYSMTGFAIIFTGLFCYMTFRRKKIVF
jgi:hypothetical protein